MVMTSFNTVERIPATCSRFLLRQVLRKEWDFQGVVISDYSAVDEMMNHSVAADSLDAGEKCVHAGMDIEMMSGIYADSLKMLLEQGRITMREIDQCVLRILKLKNRLGLFENPFKDADEQEEQRLFACEDHMAIARKLARESMVLLKNEDILPLDCSCSVGLAGPYADTGELFGGWSCEGRREETRTLKEALTEICGNNLVTAMTHPFDRNADDISNDIAEAVSLSFRHGSPAVLARMPWRTFFLGHITLPGT